MAKDNWGLATSNIGENGWGGSKVKTYPRERMCVDCGNRLNIYNPDKFCNSCFQKRVMSGEIGVRRKRKLTLNN